MCLGHGDDRDALSMSPPNHGGINTLPDLVQSRPSWLRVRRSTETAAATGRPSSRARCAIVAGSDDERIVSAALPLGGRRSYRRESSAPYQEAPSNGKVTTVTSRRRESTCCRNQRG